MSAEQTIHPAAPQPADQALLMATAASGAALASPVPFLISNALASIGVMVLLLMPYGMLGWRLARRAGDKEGPGLAVGIGVFVVISGSMIGAATIRGGTYVQQLCCSGIVATHILLTALGISRFRLATSRKSSWRVLVRAIVDPFVYFGILFGVLFMLALKASDI